MASLARCIAKAGKNVSKHDTADLMDAYERARKSGYGEREAGVVAAASVLDDAAAEVAAVTEAIRDAGVDAGVTVTRGEPVAVAKLDADGARRDRVVAVAERAWGKKLIRSLVERGVLSFVTAEDVASLGIKGLDTAEAVRENGIKGVYHGGKAYVVTDVVADKDVAGVVLHEVGVHYGLERMLGPKAFRALLYDLSRLRSKDAAVGKAYDKAERAGTADDHVDEEALAYLSEANPGHALVERMLAAVRRFLRQLGVPASILSGEKTRLVDMVVDSLRAAGRGEGTQVQQSGTKFHRAWHGSPHDFDKFDSSKIGTGEGAQAYGHGLYFGGRRAVAEFYRNNLVRDKNPRFSALSKDENDAIPGWARARVEAGGVTNLDEVLADFKGRLDEFAVEKTTSTQPWNVEARIDNVTKVVAALEKLRAAQDYSSTKDSGRLYEVELAPQEHEYLDWDKPLSEQSEKVKAGIEALASRNGPLTYGVADEVLAMLADGESTGEDLIRSLRSTEETSKDLHAAGIPGIRYKDATARGTDAESHNYVIFDDSLVEVKAKFSRDQATFDQPSTYTFTESDYRPAVVAWAKRTLDFKAPNGKPAWQNFVRWFGDSKVVDEKGEPVVVYHGGMMDESKDGVFDTPSFFTEEKEGASWFSTNRGGGITQAYLSIKNPIDIRTRAGAYKFIQIARAAGVNIESDITERGDASWDFYAPDVAKHGGYDGYNIGDLVYLTTVRDALESNGYDGVRLSDTLENGEIPAWVALNPSQIKSSTANTGTFDPANPDIRYSRAGTPAPTSTKNRITEAEREAEKRDPILKEMAQSNAETLDAAFDAIAARPALGRETVQRLKTSGTGGISLMDEAVLLIEKVRLRNARADASDRAAVPDATEEQITTALTDWHNAEALINDMDQATHQSGKEWGRLGQFRQRMMRADYTFEAMESRERVTRGRALTVDESADVKQVAERVAAAEKEAVRAATEQADAEADAGVTHTVEAIKKDAAKKPPVAPPPPADVLRDIDPADITHKDVYDLARAHILAGTHGESKVMAAVTKDLQTLDASITERQVRRLFSEYGKVTFPSAEADKVELRELRTLVRLQESITRLIEGRDALHTGPQRDKATQAIREKQHQLNDLLKERERNSAPSPEKLAGYQEARARNLRNQIEDLEREIETGEQRVVRPPPPPNDEVKALVAERDALRAKVRATVQATEKYKNEQEQKYLRAREADLTKQIEALDARIKGAPAKAAPGPKPVNAETLRLTAIRDALADELAAIEAAQKPQKSEEQKYQERRAKSIERQVKDILARIAAGDYAKRTRVDRELDAANTTAQFELAKIKAAFARRQFEIEMENRTRLQKVFGVLPEAANLARAVMTSYDLSAVLRQGGFITLGHPVRAATSIMPMLRAMVSEEQQFKVHDEIAARDNFPLYKRAGLELTEHHTHLPSKLEEQFVSRWLDYTEPKGPLAKRLAIHGKNLLLAPTRASGRAFVTFLNKLRADSFDAMVATLAKNGKTPTQEEIEAIANYINVATGRGKIGVKGKNPGTTMTTVFFAPRLVASRFNLLAGQPMYGGTGRTRALVLAEYARFLAGVAVTVGLGALAYGLGDEDDDRPFLKKVFGSFGYKPFIETDPRSTNFMKMRFGNTYVDPLAGLAQVTAFFAREATGETVTQKGDVAPLRTELRPLNAFRDVPNYDSPQWGRDTGASVLFRFVRTKFAPVPSAIVNILTGTNVIGEDTTIAKEAVSLVTPLSFRDTKAIMTDNGIAAGTAIQLLNMLGMSVQYRKPYEKKPRKSKAPVEE